MRAKSALALALNVAMGLAITWAMGCKKPGPDLSTPKTYDRDGIAFEHPANWTVQSAKQNRHTKFEIKGGEASVVLAVFDADVTDVSLDDALKSTTAEFKANIEAGGKQWGGETTKDCQTPLFGAEQTGKRSELTVTDPKTNATQNAVIEVYVCPVGERKVAVAIFSIDTALERNRPGIRHITDTFKMPATADATAKPQN